MGYDVKIWGKHIEINGCQVETYMCMRLGHGAKAVHCRKLWGRIKMKVKTITGWTEKTLDDKVNDFLSNGSIDIVDIKYSSTIFYFSAMVIYKGGNIQSS